MKNMECRVCDGNFYQDPILILNNMPKSAQGFLNKNDIFNDLGEDLIIYQCSKCNLIQLNSKPVNYYKNVIRSVAYSSEMKEFRLLQFSEFLDKYNLKGKKILEVGCGKGEYLSLMEYCDVNCYGVEYLETSVEYAQKQGLKVKREYFDDISYIDRDGPFDAFFILNFLEHIPNINSFIEIILNNLSEDGIGLIEVPNFDMILKQELFSEFISDHIFYFTKDTLCNTLQINGFDILEVNVIWYDYIISVIVKKRQRLNLSCFNDNIKNLKMTFVNYFSKYRKIAIWGAGHQSLALISLTQIQSYISFIVDSSPFKQGLYTPSTHIKVVSPSELKNSDIELIIVMAGSYCEEIKQILIKQYKKIDILIYKDNKIYEERINF